MTVEDRYDDFERRIKRSFLEFNRLVEAQLSQHIGRELIRYDQLQLDYRPLARRFASDLVNIMILGSNLSAQEAAQQLDQPLTFNPAGAAAAATFQELNQRVIQLLTQQQTEALAEMRRIAQTIEPIRSMQLVRQSLTLTARQIRAVDNFRRLLEEGSSEALDRVLRDRRFDPTIRRAIAGEVQLTTDQIDRMVDRYRSRQLDFRARTIAATEAVRIANEADNLFWRQAVQDLQVEQDTLVREWVTSKDEKVRSSHRSLLGQQRGLEDTFISGNGNSLRFPGDPRAPASDTINCRCWLKTEVRAQEQQQAA